MITRQKWTKWLWMTVLVALTSVMSTGLVLADHETPLTGVEVSSRTYYEQYLAAQEHMEEAHAAALATHLAGTNSRVRFEQYLAALEQMEREHAAAWTTIPVSTVSSRDAFAQYLTALEQMEREHAAALAAHLAGTNSRVRFEQYLEALRMMEAYTP